MTIRKGYKVLFTSEQLKDTLKELKETNKVYQFELNMALSNLFLHIPADNNLGGPTGYTFFGIPVKFSNAMLATQIGAITEEGFVIVEIKS